MKKAAIYLRTSTDLQDYERQRVSLTNECERRGFRLVHTFEEKLSGLSDERPQFQKLCQLTKEDVDYIGVWELSRLGRKTSTTIKAIEDFTEKGICVFTIKENLFTLNEDGSKNQVAQMVIGLLASMAQAEADNIKARMMDGKRHALVTGKMAYSQSVAPYGYKYNDKKQLVINEDTAPNVKEMFRMCAEDYSTTEIGARYGLDPGTIGHIIKRTAYYGEAYNKTTGDTPIPVPAIVEKELWIKANEALTARLVYKRTNIFQPLRRKILCPYCKTRHLSFGRAIKGKYEQWACHCKNVSILHPIATKAVKQALFAYMQYFHSNAEQLQDAIDKIIQLQVKYETNAETKLGLLTNLENVQEKVRILVNHGIAEANLKSELQDIKNTKKKIKNLETESVALKSELDQLRKVVENTTNYGDPSTYQDDVDTIAALIIEHLKEVVLYKHHLHKVMVFNFDDICKLTMFINPKAKDSEQIIWIAFTKDTDFTFNLEHGIVTDKDGNELDLYQFPTEKTILDNRELIKEQKEGFKERKRELERLKMRERRAKAKLNKES